MLLRNSLEFHLYSYGRVFNLTDLLVISGVSRGFSFCFLVAVGVGVAVGVAVAVGVGVGVILTLRGVHLFIFSSFFYYLDIWIEWCTCYCIGVLAAITIIMCSCCISAMPIGMQKREEEDPPLFSRPFFFLRDETRVPCAPSKCDVLARRLVFAALSASSAPTF